MVSPCTASPHDVVGAKTREPVSVASCIRWNQRERMTKLMSKCLVVSSCAHVVDVLVSAAIHARECTVDIVDVQLIRSVKGTGLNRGCVGAAGANCRHSYGI